jgi:hypothetical protein
VTAEEGSLAPRRHPRADDPSHAVGLFAVDDRDHTPSDWTDGDEPIFVATVLGIVDHEVIVTSFQQVRASSSSPGFARFERSFPHPARRTGSGKLLAY